MKPDPKFDDTLTKIETLVQDHPDKEAIVVRMIIENSRGLRLLRDAINQLAGEVEELERHGAKQQALAHIRTELDQMLQREALREEQNKKLSARAWRIGEKVFLMVLGALAAKLIK